MFLEQLWPHLPTPLVYALVLVETLIVFLYSSDSVALSLAFIAVLTISFVLGSITLSRPFHFERIAVIVTLAFVNAVFLAQHLPAVYDFLHLHTPESMFIARVVYGIVWLLLVTISIVAYFRNAGQPVSRAWPVLAIVTFIAIVIPLEPDAFVMNQPAWLWILRVLSALIIFHLVTLGDTAVVVEGLYYARIDDSTRHGYHRNESGSTHNNGPLREPNSDDAEIPLARTLIWLPITLWVMFVPKAFVVLVVFIIILMARSVYDRFQRANKAHQYFVSTQTIFAKTAHAVGIDRLLGAIYDLEGQVVRIATDHARQNTEKSNANDRKAYLNNNIPSDNESSDQAVINIIDAPEYRTNTPTSSAKHRGRGSHRKGNETTINKW